jgi:hypothetical protein
MPYHVRLHTTNQPQIEVKFDLTRKELETRILEPYRNLRPIVLGGRTIDPQYLQRVEVVETPHPSAEFGEYVKTLALQGATEWTYGESGAKDVSDEFITTPAIIVLPQRADAIELICSRFHIAAMQLFGAREK